ncbi:hypothetical protein DFJ58DRAFT_825300 [Suillus subalutaceus]|uniref:uncharacterized protein n=1 Tax=Suillus subalutaceus TaxID=48586 RepID=UPI001B87A9F8|nr:uncharacterized protein DFJ58DRAFT_825300 [Suillus subalutaceus]KAG1829732.1 hypothetical protein DFJ58DRAFT_825300 [Suillus subalutaceus]
MSVLHTPPTSPSNSQTSGNGFRPLTLTQADIAATMSMAAFRIRATQLQGTLISVVPSPVAHILSVDSRAHLEHGSGPLFSSHLCQFQDVADLGDPSRIFRNTIPNELWPWDQVFANCVCHYQHGYRGQVDESSVAMLKALRWMRERLLTVIEDQQAGIREKMAEIQMYTAVLTKLNPRDQSSSSPSVQNVEV